MIEKVDIPKFESEAEEAEWWDRHREETARRLEEAVASGKTTTLPAVLKRARARLASRGAVEQRGRKTFVIPQARKSG